MTNQELTLLLKEKKMHKWQIAKILGIHETTLCRWCRDDLTQKQVQQILSAIEELNLCQSSKETQ